MDIHVDQTGIQRVTYEMLQAAGLDLAGIPSAQIGLVNQGQAVPVHIEDQAGVFGPGSLIEFYGQALDTLYSGTNVYTLQVGGAGGLAMAQESAAPGSGSAAGSYPETLAVNNQKAFANYAPGKDPWYDTSMTVYTSPKSWNYTFQVSGLADPNAPSSLSLVVWGVTAYSQNPDHHLQISLNGVNLADVRFDGLVEETLTADVPGGVLVNGTNTLKLTLPGDTGVAGEVIDLDKYSVSYPRVFQAVNGVLKFTAAGDVFSVANLSSGNVVVYRLDAGGPVRLSDVQVSVSGSSYTARFAGNGVAASYLVTSVEYEVTPGLTATRAQAALDQPAQYLVIANPDFISGIQPLVAARRSQGLSVSVVDVNDLYTKYTYGNFDPAAIKDYIAYAYQNLGTQMVLLVGGDTYDYRNYLKVNSFSFIPSLYASTGSGANYVPVDPLYADVNGDNVPELAIGRFPVRNEAQLDLMVTKTLEYAGKSNARTAVFSSDLNDGISYKSISNTLAGYLPSDWVSQSIAMDDLGLTAARSLLINAMDAGVALVNYNGHAGPQNWSDSNLLTNSDAEALTNTDNPFVVVQWACWETYYVDPVNDYLVQKFLFSGNQGAAAVFGGTTLVNASSEVVLGKLFIPRITTPGMTLGQAMQDSKSLLAVNHPGWKDILLGWTLMGDPGLMIEP